MRFTSKKLRAVFFQIQLGGAMPKSKKPSKKFSPCKGCPTPAKCRKAGKCLKSGGRQYASFSEGWLPKMIDRWVLIVILGNQRRQIGPQGAVTVEPL